MAGNNEVYARAMHVAIGHSRTRNWADAAEAYRRAVAERPDDLAATLGLGNTLREMNQIQMALEVFERAAQLAPEDAGLLSSLAGVQERLGRLDAAAATYHRMASLALQRGNLQEAADALARATDLSPEQVEALRLLASTLERLGRPAQAAKVYATLASIHEHRGEAEPAIECYHETLRLDPDAHDVRARLHALKSPAAESDGPGRRGETEATSDQDAPGLLSFWNAEDEEATRDDNPFERARRRALQDLAETLFVADGEASLNSAATAISRAIDQQTRGQIDEAIHSLQGALEGGFDRTALFFNLGVLHFERRCYDKAIETLRHCMSDADFALGSRYALALTYRATGAWDLALEHFLEVVKAVDLRVANPDQVTELNLAYRRLVGTCMAKPDKEKATTFIETVTEFFSRPNWERRAQQARIAMDLVADGGALMTLAEYMESPETEVTVTSLGTTAEYVHRGMWATAMEECLHAIEKVPHHLPLYVRLAETQDLQGHHEQAVSTLLIVAEVYQARGHLQQAVDICHKVLEATPMEVRVRTRLAELLLSQDDTEGALEQYLALADTHYQLAEADRALETYHETLRLVSRSLHRDRWEVEILRRMGDIFVQRADWGRATWACESIVALAPEDDRARLQLIDLYYKQGQPDKALRTFDGLMMRYDRSDAAPALHDVLGDLVQAYPDEMGLRARVAVAYAAHGLTRRAIVEYTALCKMQVHAEMLDDACATIQNILSLGPERPDEYRRLLHRLQSRDATSDP